MKIRSGYVSNSSSSSFLIVGKDLKKTLELHKNDLDIFKEGIDSFWNDNESDCFTIGELITSMLNQINNYSTDEKIKGFIYSMLYESSSYFYDSLIPDEKVNTFHWDDTPNNKVYEKFKLGTEFDITDEIKNLIIKKFHKENKKNSWFYLNEDDEETEKKLKELAENIYEKLFKNKECYIFSYGDNDGYESGPLGFIMENKFIFNNYLNIYLKSNFDIYYLCEH